MSVVLRGISSMATQGVFAELGAAYSQRSGVSVQIESVGGVDAARRVQAGEAFDVVVLASDAVDKLLASGRAVASSKVDIVRSAVAVAVKAGAPPPDLSSEDAVRRAVLDAETIGYSTGPSGTALMQLFDRWGISAQVKGRLVQATPGVPVAGLVADGSVTLGFQQLSELLNVSGIAIAALPEALQIVTTFSGAVCTASSQPETARELLVFMASPDAAEAKRRHGMEPA